MSAHLSPWARQRERGGSWFPRLGVWISLRLSRTLGEGLLPPIAGWFLLTSPAARAASRDYLGRVLGRPARLRDVARHFHEFSRSVLDGLFFLTGRDDPYEVTVEGLAPLAAHAEAGRGCVLLGAHLGSFEAMRALGRQSPVQVRPAMFRANAGTFTALLERLAPDMASRIIDLGQPGAMLQVRDSLARGEIVAFLADRATDPRRQIALPFLGAPALFPTGPFRIAAMLEAPVMMFHGLRTGRHRYLLRFEPLSDTACHDTGQEPDACSGGLTPTRVEPRAVMEAYVARLEAACRAYPFQWFNFHDFWRVETPMPRLARRAVAGGAATLAVTPVRAEDDLLVTLMRKLAERPDGEITFREENLPHLTRPLVSTGVLVFRRPDYLEKRTLAPFRERLVVEGRRASVTGEDNRTRTLDVDAYAELRVLIDTLLGVLSGDLNRLRADFEVTAEGSLPGWRINLTPRGKDAPRLLRSASITGRDAAVREIRLLLPNDQWNVLTVGDG